MDMELIETANVLQKMQRCQLDILVELKKVCDANSISFYLAFGTCLGAVRHKGFIPWDDDIDVFMRVEDIERLVAVKDQFPSNFFVQTHLTDPEYGLLITRIRDSNTTLVEKDHMDRDINHGVYIDIYPLFYYGGSWIHRKMQVACSFVSRLFTYNSPPINKPRIITFASKFLLSIIPRSTKNFIAKLSFNYMVSYHEAEYVATIPDISDGRYYPTEVFGKPIFCQFEGMMMPLPSKADIFLKRRYGNYMELPPENKRIIHHNYVYMDLNNSYLKYKGVKYLIN